MLLKKRFSIFLAILSCLCLIGWGGYYYWQGTPRYSLYQIGKAIENHDSKTLLLYLDVDQIVNGLADSTFREVEKRTFPNKSSRSPSLNNKKELIKSLMPPVIKALKPILKRQIIQLVEDIGQEGKVSPLTFFILSEIKRRGEFAEVVIKTEKNQSYTFTMAKTPDRFWKVLRIDLGLWDLLQRSKREKG